MPDRIIRDELLESERWLGLKDNADRLAYIALLLKADAFGNFDAGEHRLLRLWRDFGIVTYQLVAKTLGELVEHGLVRLYEVGDRRYLHIPRFGQRLRYTKLVYPRPPWAEVIEKQAPAKTSPGEQQVTTGSAPGAHTRSEVKGSEVKGSEGKGSEERLVGADAPLALSTPVRDKVKATRLPKDWFIPDEWRDWAVKVHHLDPQKAVRISLTFRDFWHAKPGKDACKLDWFATWRNWIRRECGDA